MTGRREQKNFLRFNALLLCVMAILLVISYREDWEEIYRNPQQNVPGAEKVQPEDKKEPGTQPEETAGSQEIPGEMPDLQVHFIDVGQADCTLIELDGHFLLIDAGEEGDMEVICNYLDRHGAYEFDYVIGTHPHADHIGSMDVVVTQYEVKEILLPDVAAESTCYTELIEAMGEKSLSARNPEVGETYDFAGATFQVLGPEETDTENLNNDSIAIKLTYGETSFLFAGDAEREEELAMCESGLDLDADVLKINHHGSSSSSTEEFLQMVSPEYGVISCGIGNEYGHPTKQTMDRLIQYDISWFRTDEQGDIVATSDGKKVTWSTEPSTSVRGGE